MPLIIDHRLGSMDYDKGAEGGSGEILLFVLGAASQDEAAAAVDNETYLPMQVADFYRANASVKDQGGGLYFIDAQYRRGVPGDAGMTAGQSPGGQTTPGQDPNSALHRDVTISTGGATKKIYYSLETLHALSAGGGAAPDFGGLIGVDVKNGKVEGAEVLAPSCDVTITKRFPLLTLGWFRYVLSAIATTNGSPYLGCDVGEWLLAGVDANYKDGDTATIGGQSVSVPWTVSGKLKFSPNKTFADSPDELTLHGIDGDITIPDVPGHAYVWVMYAEDKRDVTIGGNVEKYIVQLPKFAYVERVYSDSDFDLLDLG